MESKEAEVKHIKQIKLQWNGYTPSLYLIKGQKKWEVDLCIRSLFGYHEASVTTIGLVEIVGKEEDNIDGPLIPLELLENHNGIELLKEDKIYRPQFHFYQSSDGNSLKVKTNPSVQKERQTENSISIPTELLPPPPEQVIAPVPATQSTGQNYDPYDPWQNYEYFYQYGKLGIHNEMLKDEARTKAYEDAINKHADVFKGKVVMDLGTGTGILAFFCAKVGAKKVYAVEASSLADWTELVVAHNNLSDVIKVLRGRIEELTLPEKVDIIISEWMGTFLIFESMLESLLYARDNWLKSGGILFPSEANIYLSPVSMDDFYTEKVTFWRNVYGVDMSVLIPFAKKCAFEKPIIDKTIKPESVISEPVVLKAFDLKSVPINEPYDKTIVRFEFVVNKDATFHGFGAWFDVVFKAWPNDPNEVVLSTSPAHKDTHWHQDLFLFDSPLNVKKGQVIKGTIRYQRNPDLLRHLIIDISCAIDGADANSKKFYLWGNE